MRSDTPYKKSQHVLLFLLVPILAIAAGCKPQAAHSAEIQIEGIVITVRLQHAHPYLAEYTRELEVKINGKTERRPLAMDSGGYAWIVVANDHGNLEIRTLCDRHQFPAALKDNGVRRYLGRFDFDRRGEVRRYRFISVATDPTEPRLPWK